DRGETTHGPDRLAAGPVPAGAGHPGGDVRLRGRLRAGVIVQRHARTGPRRETEALPVTYGRWKETAVSAARAPLVALRAAGAGSALFGAPAGVVMAVAVGALVGYQGRGAAGIGLGAFCGLIAAGVAHVLEGNELLLALYAIAVGVSL